MRRSSNNELNDGRARGINGDESLELETGMGSQPAAALYIVLLVATIVAIDLLFFRNQFWERLTANIGIVLVFSAFYFRFLKRS